MDRRAALLSLAGGLAASCASVDTISFDRGAFAITFEKLVTSGLLLLNGAIVKNTRGGVPNTYAQQLITFRDELQRVQADVEKQIVEAPEKSRQINIQGLQDVAGIISKAIPIILPLLGVAA